MITQKIQFNLMQNKLDDIRIVQGDTLRELQFECLDMDGEALSTEDYTYTYAQVKPDHTFIVETLTDGILQVFDQMWAITGTSYYALQIQDNNTEELVYSGQGALIVDDALISMDDMESVAEVNGYVFPTDFCTPAQVADICDSLGYAKINDLQTTPDNVWSAYHTWLYVDGAVEDLIADNTSQSLTKTWSNKKIQDEIEGMIDDDNSSEYTTYSSDKIDDLISAINPLDAYSTTEHKVGTWIDGRDVWEKTVDCGSMPITSKTVSHGVSSPALIWVENGFFYDSVSGYSGQFNMASNTLGSQANIWVSSTDIEIWTGTDRSNCDKVYVTIRYIKGV